MRKAKTLRDHNEPKTAMKNSSALGRMFGRFGVVSHRLLAILFFAIPFGQLAAQDYRISTGDDFGAVIDAEGNLFLWGAIATEGSVGGLQQIPGTWREVSVSRTSAAEAHILLIASDGSLWSFGNNDRGQLGVGDQEARTEPVQISAASTWVEVAAGAKHSLARNSSGFVYAWGDNTFGQLNVTPIFNNPAQDIQKTVPSQPIDSNTYISIATGNTHNHAIRSNNTLWTWGSSNGGPQLGIVVTRNGIPNSTPIGPVELTRVGTLSDWQRLFGGYDVTYATRDVRSGWIFPRWSRGELYAWGAGAFIGDGNTGAVLKTPTRIGTGNNWAYISRSTAQGGTPHVLALKTDNSLWGWGSNGEGQLGLPIYDGSGNINNPDNLYKVSPTRLLSPNSFLAVGAGDGFSAVINDEGFMLTAGRNDQGQLANGTIDSTPVNGQDFFDNSELGVADLVAVSVTVNEQPVAIAAGNTISVSFEIQNVGTGPITEDFDLEARFNSLATFGGLPLTFDGGFTSFTVTDDFAAGQSRSIDVEIELPVDITQGSYYLVMRADSGDAILENSETNNDAATDTAFGFLPDLVVPAGGLVITSVPSGGVYDAGTADTIDIDLQIQNIGNGTLPAGSSFEVRLFLSPDRSTTNSAIVELIVEDPLVLATDLEASPSVNSTITVPFSFEVPFMPADSYFVGVELDINEDVAEQPELLNDNNVVVQVDGETNNAAYSASRIAISGLTIQVAVDRDVAPILTFDTDGDGDWFGQASFSNDGVDAAQSPALDVGELASFRTSFATPVAISFDWSADTSSQENRLEFRVVNGTTGGNNNSISGNTDGWIENVTRVIPSNAQAEWVYFQGVEGVGDAVYVDDLQFTEITEPDLVIDDIYLPGDASGSYVLQRDRLDITVNSRNQGTSTTAGEDYVISVYLSPDPIFDRPDADPLTPDDILIRQYMVSNVIEGGDPAVNLFSVNLDTSIEPGLYYVVGYIDDYTDGNGALLPGILDNTGAIDEFDSVVGLDPFPGEDNNSFITDAPIVEIVALPDLKAESLNATLSYYFINDPASGYLEPNDLPFGFTISNQGLSAINEPFEIQALFSRDQVLEPDSDYTFLEYIYNGGFGAVGSSNVRTISPDNADFRQNIVSAGYIGERLFFGVLADSGLAIEELFENNNSTFLFNNDLILSEFTLKDALDISDATAAQLNMTFVNDQQAPYDSGNVPWVGQSSVSFDAFDAATSVNIGDLETSKFSVNLEPDVPVRVSFWWKVSSEFDPESGLRDFLGFYVDPGASAINFDNADRAIYGNEDSDWRRVEFVLDPGQHTLTWAYVKDGQGSEGSDRGWVDQLTITELPNLTVTGVSADGSVSYQAGDTINTWSVDIINNGEAIAVDTAFDIQIRLLPDADWVETDAITLLTITDDTGIGEGETRTYSNVTVGSYTSNPATAGPLTLPVAEYGLEYYYFGAYVDWLDADPASGQISESNETEADNSELTEEASIQIGRPDLAPAEAPSVPIDLWDVLYDVGDNVELDITLFNTGDGTLPAGTSYDYSVYITRTDEEGDIDASSTKLLFSGTQVVVANVDPGDLLDVINVVQPLPYGLANGTYFIAVEIDTSNDVLEQGLAPDGTGTDGEANNIFFSSAAILRVSGISLYDALNDPTDPSPIAYEDGDVAIPVAPTPYINQGLESTALWFGRDDSGDAGVGDNEVFEDGDGAQSPTLQKGEFAEFSLTVPESSLVSFTWRVFSASDLNVLSVLVDDVKVASISGNVELTEIDPKVLVPEGGVVTWRYSKGAATVGDFAYVDNLRIEDNNAPDLVLTALNYTPGEYILDIAGYVGAPDQLLGTEYLDITVEATNQGESITAVNFTTADIEVRLSTDRIYGNDNDIILGTVSQVEGNLLSGNLIRFLGPIQLGDSIPENSYYLIARIDSNDQVAEFSESNNIMISENRDIMVSRRPALRLYNPNALVIDEGSDGETNFMDPREAGVVAFDVDEDFFHYTEGPMRLRFSVQNIGLDRIQASEAWDIRIDLVGALREDVEDAQAADPQDPETLFDAFDLKINLGELSVQRLMEGRSEAMPEGQILDFDVTLAIPGGARFTALLPEDKSVTDYLWCIEVDLDANDDILQSSIVREFPARILPSGLPWRILNPGAEALGFDVVPDNPAPGFEFTLGFQPSNDPFAPNTEADEGAFGIFVQPFTVDAGDWESDFGLAPGAVAGDDDLLLAYAFNRNPDDPDTTGTRFPGTYGITEVQGDEYLSISFDFLTRASDLVYTVEADNAVGFPAPQTLAVIDGPFIDLVGPASLTGDGGLLEGYIDGPGGDPEVDNVLSVLDQGYSARITVRDNAPVGVPSRFIRVRVNLVPATPID